MTDHSRWLGALEPKQLAAARDVPLARRKLSRGVLVLMIALRVYVIVAVPLVAYAFIRALLTQ